jgi:hypothetical protein
MPQREVPCDVVIRGEQPTRVRTAPVPAWPCYTLSLEHNLQGVDNTKAFDLTPLLRISSLRTGASNVSSLAPASTVKGI